MARSIIVVVPISDIWNLSCVFSRIELKLLVTSLRTRMDEARGSERLGSSALTR